MLPKAQFIGENSGALYAMNVEVSSTVYPDRAYVSSPQRGAITYVNAAIDNTYAPTDLVNQVPAMTSATTPFGTTSSSSDQSAGNASWNAFDRSYTTRWLANAITGWVRYDFGSGNSKVINFYTVSAETDSANINRSPKTWTFEGSTDGTTWTTLDTQTNVPVWTATTEVRTYKTSNTTAYQYYRLNISVNQGATNFVGTGEFGLFSSVQTNFEMQIKVDSARYVKVGMDIDVYKAGTDTKMYTIVPTSVDNSKDTFNFLPFTSSISSVDSTTDLFTVASTTNFPTSQPIIFTSTGTVPAPLVSGTTYYVINISSTTFKVASSLSDAKISANIDLTGAGTGTINGTMSYQMAKTDELWLKDRQGDSTACILWNTDYRSPQTADFLFIAAGKTASTAISGWASSNNRMNIFTTSSLWQYDNANFIPIFKDIGCISNDTICSNGTHIIWLDATGKVRARDSNAGTDQIISRAIKNKYLNNLSSTNLSQSSAVMYDSNYKLSVGAITVDGVSKITRFIYNFDMNIWWREAHSRRQVFSFVSSISGVARCYFLDENGNMFLDEDTNLDWTDTIPWFVQYGRRTFGPNRLTHWSDSIMKPLNGMYFYATNIAGAVLRVKAYGSKDNNWQTIGQLVEPITTINVPSNHPIEGRDFDFKVSGNSNSAPAKIEGFEVWFSATQTNM